MNTITLSNELACRFLFVLRIATSMRDSKGIKQKFNRLLSINDKRKTEVQIKNVQSMQRHWQHRVHKTPDEDTQSKDTTQYVIDTTIHK